MAEQVRGHRAYNIYLFRLQMYGEPVLGLYAANAKEALTITRELVGPGSYRAFRVSLGQ